MSRFLLWLGLAFVAGTVHGGCSDGTAGFSLATVKDAAGNVSCAPGFYCPLLKPGNSTTWPVVCPADTACSIDRIFGRTCKNRVEPYEPIICPEGYYCPTYDVKIECPEGKYCVDGTVTPRSCAPLSLCLAGSKKPRYLGGLLFSGVIAIVYAVVWFMYVRKWRFRCDRDDSALTEAPAPPNEERIGSPCEGSECGEFPTGHPVDDGAIERLDGLFQKARGDRRPMRLDADELRVTLPDGKVLLHGVSGSLRPGKVTAIMGPSGAGKTVFMTTVLGRIDPAWKVEGELRVNGQQIRLGGIRSQIGFVPQDDVLHTELTVDANLYYSSEMRLPREWASDERLEMREAVLDALALKPLRHTTIGDARVRGISTSQRKRVSAGVEMVSAPPVLFLDEPTSGLDSTTSLDLVHVLKKMATRSELTVAMVVHQPRVEIWNELDELLLLAPGGRTVFLGPQRHVVDYFAAHGTLFGPQDNPADVVMDTIAARGEEFVELWKQHLATVDDPQLTPSAPKSPLEERDVTVAPMKASVFRQAFLFHVRAIEKQLTLMRGMVIEVGVLAILGCLIGFAMMDYAHGGVYRAPYNRLSPFPDMTILPQLHMFIVISIGMAAGVAGVAVFGREREQYFRDSQAGLNKLSYFIGNASASVYRVTLASMAFVSVFIGFAAMIPPFGLIWGGVFFIYWICYAVATCLSVTVPAAIAPLLASMLCNVLSLTNGYVDFPTFIKKASPTFHMSQFMTQEHVKPVSHWTDRAWGDSGYTADRQVSSFFIVVLWAVALHVLAFFLMVFTHRMEQR